MKRRRYHFETKVWRDPHIATPQRRSNGGAPEPPRGSNGASAAAQEDRRGRPPEPPSSPAGGPVAPPPGRASARIVARRNHDDPAERERERLLHRLLAAEGRRSITAAADAYREAGFELPGEQQVFLQLLEHKSEGVVVLALERLRGMLEQEPPTRRTVLDARLRRIEELAEEQATRDLASELRRMLHSRYGNARA